MGLGGSHIMHSRWRRISEDCILSECLERSALFNTCRKALGHLMKFTQRGIPYRLGLAG